MSYEEACYRLYESVGVLLESGDATGDVILTLALTLDYGGTETTIEGSQRFTVDALRRLDAGLLAICARARCECGEISPADNLLDPVSGFTCEACEW